MRALVYHGPKNVSIDDVPDARIEQPTDVLVQITTTNICGSDLHMYEGRTNVEEGKVLGHENMGKVVAIGEAVHRVRVGDFVSLPFNIGCGFYACRRTWRRRRPTTSCCPTSSRPVTTRRCSPTSDPATRL